jgi:hypothetical protein
MKRLTVAAQMQATYELHLGASGACRLWREESRAGPWIQNQLGDALPIHTGYTHSRARPRREILQPSRSDTTHWAPMAAFRPF